MPSSRAVLADLAAAGLDPTKEHRALRGGRLQASLDKKGRKPKKAEAPVVESKKVVQQPVIQPPVEVVAPVVEPKPALVFLEEKPVEVVPVVESQVVEEKSTEVKDEKKKVDDKKKEEKKSKPVVS